MKVKTFHSIDWQTPKMADKGFFKISIDTPQKVCNLIKYCAHLQIIQLELIENDGKASSWLIMRMVKWPIARQQQMRVTNFIFDMGREKKGFFSINVQYYLLKRGCELKSRETARICSRRAWWVDNDIVNCVYGLFIETLFPLVSCLANKIYFSFGQKINQSAEWSLNIK